MRTVVPDGDDGERLDRLVAAHARVGRARAKALVESGAVTVDGRRVERPSHRVAAGETVVAELPPAEAPVRADPSIEVDVVHEDDDVVVVDKPAGMIVHPGAGRKGGTLVDGLLSRYPDLAGVGPPYRPGVVHRLDRGTSGLLVVARTEAARDALVADLARHRVEREYQALVWGRMGAARGMVDAPIGRSRRDPTRRAVVADGRPARTRYEIRARYEHPDEATLLECRLETGRTHQIRVHLSAIEHPVVADAAYGGARADVGLDRPFLHARRLAFTHPGDGSWVEVESPLPPDLVATLARFS